MRYPITWGEILSVAGAVFLLMAIVCLLVYIIKRRRKNLPVFADIKPEDPPHTAALKVLHAIKEQELWKKQKAKAYYTLLTDTIRIYLKGDGVYRPWSKPRQKCLRPFMKKERTILC